MSRLLFLKIVTIKFFVVLSFLFFFSFAFTSDAEAACYCAGNYCFTGCSSCPAGSDFSVIKIKGSGPGSCTPTSTCTITNGNMVGCTPQTFSYDVSCSSCTGGYFGEGLSYDDTLCIPSCSGGPGSTGEPPVDPCLSNSTLKVRILYDEDGNGEFNDAPNNYIQRSSKSCGAFHTVDGFIVSALGGSQTLPVTFNSGCEDGIPESQWRPVQKGGRYSGTIKFNNIPSGYRITKVLDEGRGSCDEYNTATNSVDCRWCKGKTVTFLATNAEPNWCDISVTLPTQYAAPGTVSVTVRGKANAVSNDPDHPTVRVWFSRKDGTQIPNDDISPAFVPYRDPTYDWYFYSIKSAGCNSQNQQLCTKTTNVTIPAADYNVHCDVWTDPGKCSGNPTCSYESGGSRPCTGWQSCSANDNTTTEVHLPCVTGIKSPVCTNNGTSVTVGFTGGFNSSNTDQYRFIYGGLQKTRTTPGNVTFSPIVPDTPYAWFIQARRPYAPAPWTGKTCPNKVNTCVGASCDIQMPANVTKKQGGLPFGITPVAAGTTFNNVPAGGTAEVRYTSSNTLVATVSPASKKDTTSPYLGPFTTTATLGGVVGDTTVTGSCYIDGVQHDSDDMLITVEEAAAWWQVVDADVWSSGVIDSDVPSGFDDYFDEDAAYTPGYPGVPVYKQMPFNIPSTLVSTREWNANSDTVYSDSSSGKQFDYDYFWDNLPQEVRDNITVIGTDTVGWQYFNLMPGYSFEGYDFYKTNEASSFTLRNGFTLDDGRKVIVFVDADTFYINMNNDGVYALENYGNTFMMFIVGRPGPGLKGGDVQVESNQVREFGGIIVTNGTFDTGTGAVDFTYNGSVVAWNGVNLRRDLANDYGFPAETFIYRPQMLLNVPPFFGLQTMKWREVPP